jgi:hypothetical protein
MKKLDQLDHSSLVEGEGEAVARRSGERGDSSIRGVVL